MKKLFSIIGILTAIVALLATSSASIFILYQPREPKCLQK